jgi:hypothetical protein
MGTIDALRCFQSNVRIGLDRAGNLYLRRCGVAGGPDCGVGAAHRGLVDGAFGDCSLVCVDANRHVFRRADRPLGANGETRAKAGEPASVLGFGTNFDDEVTHLFLAPSNLAFVKLHWYQTLGVTYSAILICALCFSLGWTTWVLVAPGGPRLPWTIDFGDPSKHESMPREFCSWLFACSCGLNAASAAGLSAFLPWASHTSAPDTWHSPGPSKGARLLLAVIFTSVVFGKAALISAIYINSLGWWSAAERGLYTFEALLWVPWILLLDRWNLVFWKY